MRKKISERIIEGSYGIWDEFHTHPFVLGIADGSLDIEKFRYFMIQDYLYLMDYAKVFSIGASKSDDPYVSRVFSEYAISIYENEMDIHRNYMKRIGIKEEEAENAEQSQDNLSYTSYMLRTAYEYGPAHICAAVLPCAVSYEVIAKRMISQNPVCTDNEFYGEWIKGYASEDYHAGNEKLMKLTDLTSAEMSENKIINLIDTGKRCSLYEKSFWDMSWELRRPYC